MVESVTLRPFVILVFRGVCWMQVVGCAGALEIDKHWSNLVTSSKERCRYFKVIFFKISRLSTLLDDESFISTSIIYW